MGLPGRTRSLTISSAVWIQSTNVTDGQTPDDSKGRAYAWRRVGNKLCGLYSLCLRHSRMLLLRVCVKKSLNMQHISTWYQF